MSNDAPPAGWYPNPDGTGGLRWWSGVGWTEYTRAGAEQEAPAPTESAWTQSEQGAAQPTQVLGAAQTPPPDPWGQPPAPQPMATAPLGGYAPYSPPPGTPLTASGMRPLAGMFSDIGRITRRAWWPILAISVIIWGAVSALLAVLAVALVDLSALRRGFDALGAALDANPEGDFTQTQTDQITTAFSAAFDRLPGAGWAVLGILVGVLLLMASTVQIGAVSRLGMDAATANRVSWGAGWRSGFVAGFRLFGYYVLIMVLTTLAVVAVTVAIVLAAQLSPALAVALGLLAFLGTIAVGFWLTGRLIPVIAQAVVGGGALRWSWRATRGKFWAVLGRYLLWSLAASVVINVITTILSIPVSLLFLGEAANTADPFASMGTALLLNLLLLPFSMATAAIATVGIVPIWRDLTDHPVYRSIDEQGVPVPAPTVPRS